MTAIACPYCGAMMNAPIKFCVSCGRAVGSAEIRKFGGLKMLMRGGITKRLNDTSSSRSYDLSKKSYGWQRSMRHIMLNLSYILLGLFLYYCLVRFVFKVMPPNGSDSPLPSKAVPAPALVPSPAATAPVPEKTTAPAAASRGASGRRPRN